jgi:DNA gyrase/topoisomerase IV subunit A
LLGERLEAGRTSLAQAQQWCDQDQPVLNARAALSIRQIVSARPGDELLLMTNLARAYRQMSADVPELEDKGRWPGSPQDAQLQDAERLTAAVAVQPPPRLWTVVTRRGYVQRLVWAGMERSIAQGAGLLPRLDRRDAPVALVPGGQGDLAIFTRWGQAIRFPLHTIETQGSMALDLDPDDQVVAALALSGDLAAPGHEVLLVTASGRGLRRDVAQLPARSRPGGTTGKTLINARDLLAVFAPLQSQLIFATYSGKIVFAPVESAARHDRLAQGSRLCDLDHDPAVAVTQIP